MFIQARFIIFDLLTVTAFVIPFILQFLTSTVEFESPKTGVSVFLSIKSLTLSSLNFNSRSKVLFALDFVQGSPNLQSLKITVSGVNIVHIELDS